MKLSNYFLLIIAASTMIACGSSKKTSVLTNDEVLVETYCSGDDYLSTSKAFRYTGIGESMDQMTAKKKAMSEARAGMASTINTKVKAVTDNFVKSSNYNNKEELMSNYEGVNREVVNQSLTGAVVICEKTTRSKSTGNYKVYICLELGSNNVMQAIANRMSADEQLKVDYNYEKFKKTFDEEMKKFDN